MDFLSAIPAPKIPMAPIEPGSDGTPPLPLSTPQEDPVPSRSVFPEKTPKSTPVEPVKNGESETMTEVPAEDVFESDPFFNPEPDGGIPFDADVAPLDDVPTITIEPEPPVSPATAEERLLDTIVNTPPPQEPDSQSPAVTEELTGLRAERDQALADRNTILTARDRARQELQILKTRFSTLESDLAAARMEVGKANQLRLQAESRHAESELQWNDKLTNLRRMLDEVETIRDELNTKRVSKILFIGAVVAGLLATTFAYFIGAGINRTPETRSDIKIPAASPMLAEHPAPASPMPRETPTPAIFWPSLNSEHWAITQSPREMTVVFNEGVFVQGVELATAAKQDLKTIAASIKARKNAFFVEVEGHTDATPVKKTKVNGTDNKELGLARAKAAAAYLIKQGGYPEDRVTTSSAGDANPPHPNTTPESRKKNRTVVLKIREAT
ncbi:MAG: OmpA family protein [bacterium]